MSRWILPATLLVALTACSQAPVAPPSEGHLRQERLAPPLAASIPPLALQTYALPKPEPRPKTETYTVVVNNVRVHDLLFALARDAKLNIDIHPGIEGTVTMNAIDQTLPQLLARIAKQVDMRWELDGKNLVVMPDTPFLRTYRVDYVNMTRDTSGIVAVTTQIASTGMGTPPTGATAAGAGGNNSLTKIENKAQNRFWETLEKNIRDILRETDKILPEGSSETIIERQDEQATTGTGAPTTLRNAPAGAAVALSPNPVTVQQTGATVVRRTTFREAASVIVHPETGIVSVRATARQHEKVQEFLDQVMASARRQVLIEATVAEVTLTDHYQQGIDWSRVASGLAKTGLAFSQTGAVVAGAGVFTIQANQTTSSGGAFRSTLKLLEDFGDVRVISSPKLAVLNNQTAVLKVVDNLVYFTIKADTTTNQTTTTTTYTTNLHSVPVGLVMNVTPQISHDDTILLNIRPSISRKYAEVEDPNPELRKNNITSRIPVIRTREMESMLRVENGNIAVMGGLMEDGMENNDQAVPGLSSLPWLGSLFQNRSDLRRKTELVVFLRPVIIKDASLEGDFAEMRPLLPGKDFFEKGRLAPPRVRLGDRSEEGGRP
ncbi:MAG: pilus (MSHA type) biogenesis protein MshL [Rhodocyclaceae bacterium]|nr:pilus (MSHA type) biogenesis protein MshL [Rhodocyclaceae bacterium]